MVPSWRLALRLPSGGLLSPGHIAGDRATRIHRSSTYEVQRKLELMMALVFKVKSEITVKIYFFSSKYVKI